NAALQDDCVSLLHGDKRRVREDNGIMALEW
ncbi:unnamed protein product, partial [marine sediment metagenome]